jgi:hypothetical protein
MPDRYPLQFPLQSNISVIETPRKSLENMARPARLELATLCLEACFGIVAFKGPILNPWDLIVPYRLFRFLCFGA